MRLALYIVGAAAVTAAVSAFAPSPGQRALISRKTLSKTHHVTLLPSVSFSYNPKQQISTACAHTIGSRNPSQLFSTDATFDEKQGDFIKGYLNKHHKDLLTSFATAFTELGVEQVKKNRWSGGSFKITEAELVDVSGDAIALDVTVKERNEKEPRVERVECSLDAEVIKGAPTGFKDRPLVPPQKPGANPVDCFVRKMNRLCLIVGQPEVTGKLIQLAIQIGGDKVGEVKSDLYLNQVPHNRFVRQYFYDMAADAALEAVIDCSQGKISNRMKMQIMFPEVNPRYV